MSTPATNVLGRDPLELESILCRLAAPLARQENQITLPSKRLIRFTKEKAVKKGQKKLPEFLMTTHNVTQIMQHHTLISIFVGHAMGWTVKNSFLIP